MRIAIIGCGGRISGVYAHHIRKACPTARVVGVIDPDEQSARARLPADERDAVPFFTDLDQLMRNARPEAILIGTRCNLHARYAIAVAPYGIPLFLEKPVAIDLDEAIALERAWAGRSDQVVVSFPLRVSPLVEQAQRWMAEPATGRMTHLNAVNYVTYGWHYFEHWYRDSRLTGGLLLQKATHDFDYLAHLAGAPIARVATLATYGRVHQDLTQRSGAGESDVAYHAGIGTPESGMNEDCSSSLIEFANGLHGTYSQVFFARHDAGERGVTVSGQCATIAFDWCSERIRRHWHHAALSEELHLTAQGGHAGGDDVLGANFVAVVQGTARSRTSLQAGLESVYACLAAKESVATGQFTRVRRWGQA
jgi:predicted dehydrogenase